MGLRGIIIPQRYKDSYAMVLLSIQDFALDEGAGDVDDEHENVGISL